MYMESEREALIKNRQIETKIQYFTEARLEAGDTCVVFVYTRAQVAVVVEFISHCGIPGLDSKSVLGTHSLDRSGGARFEAQQRPSTDVKVLVSCSGNACGINALPLMLVVVIGP